MVLVLQALQNDKNLTERTAAKIYGVDCRTLGRRRTGKPVRRDIPANLRKLIDLEERIIVQYILELDARIFPPRLCGVEDMANHLLRTRSTPPVGKLWAYRFVKR
jgi:hypothetical protein